MELDDTYNGSKLVIIPEPEKSVLDGEQMFISTHALVEQVLILYDMHVLDLEEVQEIFDRHNINYQIPIIGWYRDVS